ncbi:MAG: glycosyltransferase family 2 protein [Nitrospirota bacterium]
MLNVLLPIAGTSSLFDSKLYPYPIPLIEVLGKPIIQRVVENLSEIGGELRFVFVVRAEDCRRFYLDNTLTLLTERPSEIVRLEGDTRGALCSALMAITHIDNNDPLVVANSDQLFEDVLPQSFSRIVQGDADAGCLCFESVHPRWSYVRVEDGRVTEAAEKKPISRRAIAGFYYFATGHLFVQAAMKTILSQRTVDDRYFIAPVFNELILEGKRVLAVDLPPRSYVSFFTPQRIEEYERSAGASGVGNK